jgi:GNAT superfamily N-acetyltransferase
MSIQLRLARPGDVFDLNRLIERSARVLSRGYYTPAQIQSAIQHVFGVDSTLVADGTYYVATDGVEPVGCGGWSRRRTLYGGDQRPVGGADLLDPAREAARIRAFFVSPSHARRGVGRMLLSACEEAARAAGFRRLELMATLPGVPLYAATGFRELERVTDRLPDGVAIEFVRMTRPIAGAELAPTRKFH